MIRVLVADDHPVVRTGLREILVRRCDITMLGEAGTSAEVRQLVAQKPWDVVVLDLSLPDLSGLELVKENKVPDARSVALVLEATRRRGVLVGKGGLWGNVLRVAPPLTISRTEVDELVAALDASFAEVTGRG